MTKHQRRQQWQELKKKKMTLRSTKRRGVVMSALSNSAPLLCLRISLLQLLLLLASQKTTQAQDIQLSDNYYCGETWPDAAKNCHRHCPSGDHGDCADLGVGWQCFQFTGCYVPPEEGEEEVEDSAQGPNNQYCGVGWVDAMVSCNKPCPRGTECSGGDRCYAATNCDKPLVKLESDLVVTMMGPSSQMDNGDIGIFTQTLYDTLRTELEKESMMAGDVGLTGQSLAGRRELEHRYSGRNLKGWQQGSNFMVSNVTQRMLPVGSSALDASIVVTGEYRPPPYKDLDMIAEDSINRQGEKVVSTLRERGERAGREFFNRVDGIEAISAADMTNRPTRAPTGKPTPAPTGPPTATPSMAPTSEPSSMPSSEPSRSLDQLIMTGSADDLQLGGKTTSSYGFIFNIRTPEDGPTIVITGLDFYTGVSTPVNYEVWSKNGSFQGFKGKFDEWELVSKGTINGKGLGRYTPIPEEAFLPLSIPGGGGEQGTRAIYITMDEKSLVYKIGEGVYADEVIQVSTPDVEIWEGESVLQHPFPDPVEYEMFYRYPRQFLGAIRIDRLPCAPFSLYGPVYDDLPCPRVPTGSPTLPMPTKSPVTEEPTVSPITLPVAEVTLPPQPPTRSPSAEPTSSRTPTYSPSEPEPTSSPIVSTKAHFVSVFRNVPPRPMNEREEEKFKQIVLSFLQTFTEDSMVIDDIEIWHQKSVLDTELTQAKGEGASANRNKVVRSGEALPQVYSLEVTVIMSITYFFLPSNLLGPMAAETIDDNQELLLDLFRGQNSFYGYFKQMDNIESVAIDSVTIPPSKAPITQAQAFEDALVATDLSEEAPTGNNFGVFVGVGVAALWCCLTAISVTYVLKKRGEMEEMHDMEELLAQEKQAKPVMAADTDAAEWKKPETAKEDEEAPRNTSKRGVGKVTGSRHSIDDHASTADSEPEVRSSVAANDRAPVSRKSSQTESSVAGSFTSMERSEHTSGGRQHRASRTTSLRNSLTSSGLRSSLTELKGSFNKSVKHVSRGVEAVRRDGVMRSSRRSTRNSSMRSSSTGHRHRSSARVSMRASSSSVARSSASYSRARRSDGSVSVSASVRKSSNSSVANSLTSSRHGSRVHSSDTERVKGAHKSDHR